MLRQRIITAAVLLLVLVAVLALPGPQPFAWLVLVVALLTLFEWWRMTLALPSRTAVASGGDPARPSFHQLVLHGLTGWRLVWRICTSLFAVWLFVRLLIDYSALGSSLIELMSGGSERLSPGTPGWTFALDLLFSRLWVWAAAGWLIAAVYVFIAHTDKPPFSLAITAFGMLAVPAAGTALLAAHARGLVYLLSLMAIVWAADIGAYFIGRAAGGPKLAPRISPGKTISGAAGGILVAVLWVGLTSLWTGEAGQYTTYGAHLVERWGLPAALALTVMLAAVSIVGDLFESLLKRRAGRKDSSQLLPGHGGFYDRVDALLPVVPLAMLLVV